MEQLLVMNLYNINLIKAINYGVIPVAGYVNNVLDLRKSDLEDLHKIVKSERQKMSWKAVKRRESVCKKNILEEA